MQSLLMIEIFDFTHCATYMDYCLKQHNFAEVFHVLFRYPHDYCKTDSSSYGQVSETMLDSSDSESTYFEDNILPVILKNREVEHLDHFNYWNLSSPRPNYHYGRQA